jgi:hypothetical protein
VNRLHGPRLTVWHHSFFSVWRLLLPKTEPIIHYLIDVNNRRNFDFFFTLVAMTWISQRVVANGLFLLWWYTPSC